MGGNNTNLERFKTKARDPLNYLVAMEDYEVSRKQWEFAVKYCGECECTAWRAAALTYGKKDGIIEEGGSMKKAVALSIGFQNMQKPHIRLLIQDMMGEMVMKPNEVLHRISTMARANFLDLVDIDPETKQPKINLAKAQKKGAMLLIKKMTLDSFGNLKSIELHDAFAALTKLGQHHKVFDRQRETVIDPKDLARELLDDLRAKHEQLPDSILIEKVLARFSGSGVTESDLIDGESSSGPN